MGLTDSRIVLSYPGTEQHRELYRRGRPWRRRRILRCGARRIAAMAAGAALAVAALAPTLALAAATATTHPARSARALPWARLGWRPARYADGKGYDYDFYVSVLACGGGATGVSIGKLIPLPILVPCVRGHPSPWLGVGNSVAPGHTYQITVQAVRAGGRGTKQGPVIHTTIQMPDSGAWVACGIMPACSLP